ncbi:MAG TPA: hypothetical protein VFZ83_13470 [Acidimicrobiia bacterium]|nr:hypothetical protein [Acidimicrobiia bacterium]
MRNWFGRPIKGFRRSSVTKEVQAERTDPGVGVRITTRDNMREGYLAVVLGVAALSFGILPALAAVCLVASVQGIALGAHVRWRAEHLPGRVGSGLGVAAIACGALGAAVSSAGLFGA